MPRRERPPVDHDAIVDMWPRLETIEGVQDRLQVQQDRLTAALDGLRGEVTRVRDDLAARIDTSQTATRSELGNRLDRLEDHLTAQDSGQADLRADVASASARWPQGAVVLTTAVVTAIVAVLASVIAHVRW